MVRKALNLDLVGYQVEPELFIDRIVASLTTDQSARQALRKKSLFIIKVSRSYWLCTGRNPVIMAGSAILLAHSASSSSASSSSAVTTNRVRLAKACDCSVTILSGHCREMKKILVNFARKAPHYTAANVKEKNIHSYLDEIIQDEFLLNILSQAAIEQRKETSSLPPAFEKASIVSLQIDNQISRNLNSKEATINERDLWIRKMYNLGYKDHGVIKSHWNLFPNVPLDEDNVDSDSSDFEAELNSYLRSDKEIALLNKVIM